MLTEERRAEIEAELTTYIQGGCTDDLFQQADRWIENFDENEPYFKMSKEEWDANETEICSLFDDNWFTCAGCNWTVPRGMESYNQPEYCTDCEEDSDD